MGLFDWTAWDLAQAARLKAGRAQERWFLQKLHAKPELTALASAIAEQMHQREKRCAVQLQSVWVDSLPQAIGQANGRKVKCELADLLYVVKVKGVGGALQLERAVLMQAKMAPHHTMLPVSGSTRKERDLLEGHDWSTPVELHRAHKPSKRERPVRPS